jgi:hypothetical protein
MPGGSFARSDERAWIAGRPTPGVRRLAFHSIFYPPADLLPEFTPASDLMRFILLVLFSAQPENAATTQCLLFYCVSRGDEFVSLLRKV